MVVYEKYDIQKMKLNTLTNPLRISNDDYLEIVKYGEKVVQSYSSSSTPIKITYMSDITSFKSTFFDFTNKNWLICDSQPMHDIRVMMIIATMILR